MKKLPPYIGIYLIILGVLALLATRFHSFASHNTILLSGLLAIVLGILLYIRGVKHETDY